MNDFDFTAAVTPVESMPVIKPASGPPDLSVVRGQLAEYEERLATLEKEAQALVVQDDKSSIRAVEISGTLAGDLKELEASRKAILAPVNAFEKKVQGLFKPVQSRMLAVIEGVKAKIRTHEARVEMERRAKQEEQRKAVEALQKKLDEDAKAAGVESVAIITPVEPIKPTTIRTEAGSMHMRSEWKWEVTDVTKLDRRLLKVDEQAINREVKAGLREEPGLRIWEEKNPVVRG